MVRNEDAFKKKFSKAARLNGFAYYPIECLTVEGFPDAIVASVYEDYFIEFKSAPYESVIGRKTFDTSLRPAQLVFALNYLLTTARHVRLVKEYSDGILLYNICSVDRNIRDGYVICSSVDEVLQTMVKGGRLDRLQ